MFPMTKIPGVNKRILQLSLQPVLSSFMQPGQPSMKTGLNGGIPPASLACVQLALKFLETPEDHPNPSVVVSYLVLSQSFL